jgi:2,3-dihydroxybenzoate decarboxylase
VKTIAIEEHFWTPAVRDTYPPQAVGFMRKLTGGERLDDLDAQRIAAMDAAGIDVQVLSHWQPGVQDAAPADAVALARESNDQLHAAMRRHPTRFGGFATLPTPDPAAAAVELERCVRTLGFCGALINGFTNEKYLDEPEFAPILERAEALDVPIYLHPRTPHPAVMDAYFRGQFALSAAAWGYAVETGTHALRMIVGGVFDRYPRLRLILGHLGENIPFALWRFDHSLTTHFPLQPLKLERRPRDYVLQNFLVTTSGNFDPAALRYTISVLGIERVLFASDYPVESLEGAVGLLTSGDLTEAEREHIAYRNAETQLRLAVRA